MKNRKYILPGLLFLVGISLSIYPLAVPMGGNNANGKNEADRILRSHNQAIELVERKVEDFKQLIDLLRNELIQFDTIPSCEETLKTLDKLNASEIAGDSLIVSWIDSLQYFRCVLSADEIDPFSIIGTNVSRYRSAEDLLVLNKLMYTDSTIMFPPINMVEGWASLPINFGLPKENGKTLGYVAPLLPLSKLFYFIEDHIVKDSVLHEVLFRDSIRITSKAAYDGTEIHNSGKDLENELLSGLQVDPFLTSERIIFGEKWTFHSYNLKSPKTESSPFWVYFISVVLIILAIFIPLVGRTRVEN